MHFSHFWESAVNKLTYMEDMMEDAFVTNNLVDGYSEMLIIQSNQL